MAADSVDSVTLSGAAGDRPWPTTVQTERLVLRPPTEADRAFHHALHSDPKLFGHSPHALQADRDANSAEFDAWLQHWSVEGFGYWVAADRHSGIPVGMTGVRRSDDALNLYYRFMAVTHGSGIGREAARAGVAWAMEWQPSTPVHAITKRTNAAAIKTAIRAGLSDDHSADGTPYGRWVSPTMEVLDAGAVGAMDDQEVRALTSLWYAVVRSGGSVGFRAGATRRQVQTLVNARLADCAAGQSVLVRLRDASGELIGLAFWHTPRNPLFEHTAELRSFMVTPTRRRENLGRIFLAGLHAVARDLPGRTVATLDYRSGEGLGAFYRGSGYVEVGRKPGLIQVEPGVFRDGVVMMRRLDGSELRG